MRRILIVQEYVPHYRVSFFEKLREALLEENLELRVAHGNQPESEAYGYLNTRGGLAFGSRTRSFRLLGGRLLVQLALKEVMRTDLVIVEQANRHLLNYLLLLLSRLRLKKVAFWGHGWNRQRRSSHSASERVKAWLVRYPDWWFAYTRSAAEFLQARGVEAKIITVVQNSVDVAVFQNELAEVGDEELSRLRSELGIGFGAVIGLYCGRLYQGKKLRFLMRAALKIRHHIPDFHLILIGEGPFRAQAVAFARREEWIHYVGAKLGKEKAQFFKLAQVFLNPGTIGLPIIDAFAGGLPVITTDLPIHGPEIDYFENGRNGVMCRPKLVDYAGAVVEVLTDRALYARLSAGAKASCQELSLAAMVTEFQGRHSAVPKYGNRISLGRHCRWSPLAAD